MAEALQTTFDGTPSGVGEKLQKQCYSREKKLEVIAFYQSHNLYQTVQKFSLNTKTVLHWHLFIYVMDMNNVLQIADSFFLARHLYSIKVITIIITSLIERPLV